MAIYRQVYMSFWTDPKVVNDFTPEDRYFYLYLITNSHTNLCGCYEISIRQMAWETGYNEDTVSRLISRLSDLGVIKYDNVTKEVLLLNWHKYNWTNSPKLTKAVTEKCKLIKNIDFREYIIYAVNGIPYTYPIDTSVTDTVSDTVAGANTGS